MKIKNIKIWSVDLGNKKPYTIAFKTIDVVKNCFVEITLENGLTGIGAGNPSQYVTGESFQSMENSLSQENVSFLMNRDIRHLNLLLHEVVLYFPKNPAAQAALDIALHDAFCRWLNIPLVQYFGQHIKSMPTSNTIGIKNVDETLHEAEEYGKMGFTILKVKLGKSLDEDIERLVKLREKFGNRFIIRVDANQGYSVEQTNQFFIQTAPLNIELVEQPLPAKSVDDMRTLPESMRKKIAADESLLIPSSALQLLTPSPACGIFNIKLMKCGGLHQARQIATIAEAANIELFWGCNDESIVSITAALHLAFACSHTQYIDLDGSLDLAHDIVRGGFILENGVMRCSDKAGLGVDRI